MTTLTEDARQALLVVYADIDAEGGGDPGEGEDFNRGFRVGLELALEKIDQMLNAEEEPDPAWIAEGLARLRRTISSSLTPPPQDEGRSPSAREAPADQNPHPPILAREEPK
jgi:hypothetical protein